jgi:hypothetical protein
MNGSHRDYTASHVWAIRPHCSPVNPVQPFGPPKERHYGRLDMAFNNAGIVGFTGDPADESVRRVAFGSLPYARA